MQYRSADPLQLTKIWNDNQENVDKKRRYRCRLHDISQYSAMLENNLLLKRLSTEIPDGLILQSGSKLNS